MSESRLPAPGWIGHPAPPPLHAVAQAMADGETWLFAWAMQSSLSYRHLARDSHINHARLMEIDEGAPITRDELALLAKVWHVDAADIARTLPPGALAE